VQTSAPSVEAPIDNLAGVLASTDLETYEEAWEHKTRRMSMKLIETEERLGTILGAPLENLEKQPEAWEEKMVIKNERRRSSAVHMAFNQRQEEYKRKSIRVLEVQQALEETNMLPTPPRNNTHRQSVKQAADSLFAHLSMSLNKAPSITPFGGGDNGRERAGTSTAPSSSSSSSSATTTTTTTTATVSAAATSGRATPPVPPLSSKGSSSDLTETATQASRVELAMDGALSILLALEPEDEIGFGPDGEPLYSYQELVRRNYCKEYCGLDEKMLEKYMTDRDFRQWFGVSKQEFEKQPQWKRNAKKKELLLF